MMDEAVVRAQKAFDQVTNVIMANRKRKQKWVITVNKLDKEQELNAVEVVKPVEVEELPLGNDAGENQRQINLSGLRKRRRRRRQTPNQILSDAEEESLKKTIRHWQDRGFPITSCRIKEFCFEYCDANRIPNRFYQKKRLASKGWYNGFLARHPDVRVDKIRQKPPSDPIPVAVADMILQERSEPNLVKKGLGPNKKQLTPTTSSQTEISMPLPKTSNKRVAPASSGKSESGSCKKRRFKTFQNIVMPEWEPLENLIEELANENIDFVEEQTDKIELEPITVEADITTGNLVGASDHQFSTIHGPSNPILSEAEEESLKNAIRYWQDKTYPVTSCHIKGLCFEYCDANGIPTRFDQKKRLASTGWYNGFLARHPDVRVDQTLRNPPSDPISVAVADMIVQVQNEPNSVKNKGSGDKKQLKLTTSRKKESLLPLSKSSNKRAGPGTSGTGESGPCKKQRLETFHNIVQPRRELTVNLANECGDGEDVDQKREGLDAQTETSTNLELTAVEQIPVSVCHIDQIDENVDSVNVQKEERMTLTGTLESFWTTLKTRFSWL